MHAKTRVALVLLAGCGAPAAPRVRPAPSAVASTAPSAVAPSPVSGDQADDDDAPKRRVVPESMRRHEPWKEPLPHGAVARLGTTRFQHGINVAIAAAKGTLVSASTYYGALQRWDAKTGELLATGKLVTDDTLNVAAVAPGGATAIFATYYAIYVVDTDSLKTRFTKTFFERDGDGSRIEDVAFFADGRIMVGACSKNPAEALRVLDARGDEVQRIDVPRPKESYDEACASRVEASPDGKLLGAAVNGKARLYSMPEGRELAAFESGVSVQALAFSHDGARLYVGGYGEAVNAFDTKTHKAVRSFGFFEYDRDRQVNAISLSPDDRTVAVDVNGVRLYDASTGTLTGRLPRLGGGKTMSFPSTEVIAYPVADPVAVGRFDLEKAETLAPVDLGAHDGEIRAGAFSPDGAAVYTAAADATLRRWDTKTGAPTATWAGDEAYGGLVAVEVASGSGAVLTVGSTGMNAPSACELLFHDPTTLEVTARVKLPLTREKRCDARALVVSPNGARAFVVGSSMIASIDLAKKTPLTSVRLDDASAPRSAVAALADGTIAYACERGVVEFDGETLKEKRALELDPSISREGLEISHDGRRAASLAERGVSLVDLASGKEIAKAKVPAGREVLAAAFSAGDERLLIGYRDGETSGVAELDATTLKTLGDLPRLHGPGSPVPRVLTESPDGKRLLEGSSDTSALVLDMALLAGGSK